MTEAQYKILTEHKHVYDFYKQVQTVNSAHPSMAKINEVYTQLGFPHADMSCSRCVCEMLDTIYNIYNQTENIWQ